MGLYEVWFIKLFVDFNSISILTTFWAIWYTISRDGRVVLVSSMNMIVSLLILLRKPLIEIEFGHYEISIFSILNLFM